MHILDELRARGLVQEISHEEELKALLSAGTVTFYVGYDPTAPSLHLGSLVPIIVQARLQRAGHRPICVVGGATGMIGDPSGKSEERNLLDTDTLRENVAALRSQLARFLDFGDGPTGALLTDNHEWLSKMSFIDILRDVGKHLTINYMIAKESVRARLEDRDQGISYTEFSYMLLQAYDFVHLARVHGCRLGQHHGRHGALAQDGRAPPLRLHGPAPARLERPEDGQDVHRYAHLARSRAHEPLRLLPVLPQRR
jgi:tyrosyl-tRNA synthetase